MTDAQILEPLDWHTVTCQCEHTHRVPGGCPNTATRQVEIHSLGDCNRADLSPFGNHVMLLCDPCLAHEIRMQTRMIERLTRYGIPICTSCGAPIADIGDVIRENRPIA